MQAIILAAGMGRRLGENTKNNTKCMVSVNGVKLIDRLLGQLAKLHLQRIIIVVGYKAENLICYLNYKYNNRLNIEFIHNSIYDKTNNIYSLSLAKKQLQEDDTLLIESDLIFSDNLFDIVINNDSPNIALVARYEPWMDGTMVCIDEDDNIINFIPKKAFNYEEVKSYYKTVNIYKFSKEFSKNKYVPFLEAYCTALGNNEYYEQVLRVITLLDKNDLKAIPIGDEKWYEIDDIQDLDIAETIFSDESTSLQKYNKRYGGYWRFPKLLDFCYLVNPYFPPQRMKDELRANFDALLSEYPSGMSVNTLLGSKYFSLSKEFIVIGNGAAELINSTMEILKGKIGIVYPTFEEYPNRRDKNDIVSYTPDNDDFHYSYKDLINFFDNQNINNLLLVNPDNPSGNYIPKKDVLQLARWCLTKGIKFIVDESFVDFSDNYYDNSLLQDEMLKNYPNMIVIKSISKSYGVPGLRLGILASSDTKLISCIKKDLSIWNINSFAEFYMQIYNKYVDSYTEACNKFIVERKRFAERLHTISFLRIIPSQANFFLCEVIDAMTSEKLASKLLLEYNILIKDCSSKKGLTNKNYIRIAIRNKTDNDKLINALLKFKI